jgi:crossover junction endodeoxyribonuclease RusA
MTTLTLPFPPSVNTYWRMVRGRMLISKAGREYRQAVQDTALVSRWDGWGPAKVAVEIIAWLPDNRRRDADNLFKAPLDALAHAGLYDDDSQIIRLSIQKAGVDRANPRLEIQVRLA